MKTLKYLSGVILAASLFIACDNGDADVPDSDDCSGQVCEASPGTNEASTTVPNTLHGTYNMSIAYAESNSPYPQGTQATFTITADRLTVAIDGEECFSIVNPVTRGGLSAPLFKGDCVADIAFQVAANQSGALEEINLVLASGPGYYGQFRID